MRVENLAHTLTRGHCTRAKFNALSLNFDAAANAIAELNNFFSGCCNECRCVCLLLLFFRYLKRKTNHTRQEKKEEAPNSYFKKEEGCHFSVRINHMPCGQNKNLHA